MATVTAHRSQVSASGSLRNRLSWAGVLGVTALVVVYLSLAVVLPIEVEAPIVDEPIYAKSAFEWARTGTIEISGLSAPNAVFETIWGGLFARVFGETYQALRLSTLVLTALSAPFMYWLCRTLGAGRAVSLVATAAYLFNPLVIVLSATFMTDAHFMALVVMSVALFVRGMIGGRYRAAALFAGAAAASVAFLSRPQALVVPLAALLVLLFRSKGEAKPLRILAIVALPAVVFAVHSVWTSKVGAPFIRELSTRSLFERAIGDAGPFAGRLILMATVYIGLITLPMVPLLDPKAAVGRRRSLIVLGLGLGVAALYLAMLVGGYDPTSRQSFMSPHGMGAVERSHLGDRPALWPGWVQAILGLIAAASTYLWAMKGTGRWGRAGTMKPFLFLVLAGLLFGAVAASMTLHGDILDRYWLPMIPLMLAVAAATADPSRIRVVFTAFSIAAVGFFGLAGTHDALTAYNEVAVFADEMVDDLGISPLRFEGGAAWSARTFGVADDGPEHILERSGPYWVMFYAVDTRPEYGVALEPLDGYEVLDRREFPSILHLEPTYVYLIRGDADIGYFIDADDF